MTDDNAKLIKAISKYNSFRGAVSYWKARIAVSPEIAQERITKHQASVDSAKIEISHETTDPNLLGTIEKCAEEMDKWGFWDGGLDLGDEELHKRKRREHLMRANHIMFDIEAYLSK